ncbi:hypothetical protein K525DRAFT_214339 [Schizophyllum commune Loenen D]|nr:hypothetical protein K525DRAFT_214339 [Schizophyllum commune Loenen D]
MTSHGMSTITPSQSNAHTALDINELLEVIFRSENLSKSDLRRLCLVSRAWNAVAERVLWGELSDLRLLFNLLPIDAIPNYHAYRLMQAPRYLEDDEGRTKHAHHPRELRPEDWSRFKRIAHFVRAIRIDFGICREDQFRILRCPPGEFLLPGLRKIEFCSKTYTHVEPEFLRLLLAPTITNVRQQPTFRPVSAWSLTVSSLPNLSHLRLEKEYDPDLAIDFYCAFAAAVQKCPILKCVALDVEVDSSAGILPALASCPALRELRVSIVNEDLGGSRTVIPCRGFAALRVLICGGTTLPFLLSILSSRSSMSLHTVDAGVPMLTTDDLRVLLGAVHAHVDPNTLASISISNTCMRHAHQPIPLQKESLLILAEFRNLSRIVLRNMTSIALGDEDWREVAGWWPKLEHLRLETDFTADLSSACPLSTLAYFSRCCPRLAHLELPIDATFIPSSADVGVKLPPADAAPARMQIFVTPSTSPIEHADAVARYLAGVFPTLRAVIMRYSTVPREVREVLWREVGTLVAQRRSR